MKHGKILPKDTMLMRLHTGTATQGPAQSYDMSVNVGNNCPIVESKQTGKWFTLSWADIISMAQKAGIDTPDSQSTHKKKDHKNGNKT